MNRKPPTHRQHRVVSIVVAATVAAGCGGPTPRDTQLSTPSTPPTPTEFPPELIRTAGTVVSGAEPDCLILETVVRRYHLVNGAEAGLKPGQEVTVTGLADPNTTSTCEQTTPLTIDKAEPTNLTNN
jgi:hypothetical protein